MARYHYPLPLGGRQNYGDFGGKPWRTWHAPFSDKSKWQTSNISMFVDGCPVGTWSLSMIASCFAGLNMSVRTPKQKHHGFWAECFDQDKLTKLCESHRVSMHDLFTLMVPAATARNVLPLFCWLDKHCRR